MIKLEKLAEPNSLIQNKARWTEELVEAIKNGNQDDIRAKKRKYNRTDVKEQLKAETNEKCAYCESKVTVVAHGDIEHVTPKSARPELTFEWDNLTFACQKCNGNKADKEGLVDPYVDLIEEHFFFVGPLLRGRTEKGQLTEKEIKLNRTELIDDRLDHLKVLADTLEKIAGETDSNLKELCKKEIRDHLNSNIPEYIFMKKTAFDHHDKL